MENTMPLSLVIDGRFEALQREAKDGDWFHALDMEPTEDLGAIEAAKQLILNTFSDAQLAHYGLNVVSELVKRARTICLAAETAVRELAACKAHGALPSYVADCRSQRLVRAIMSPTTPDDVADHQGERVDR